MEVTLWKKIRDLMRREMNKEDIETLHTNIERVLIDNKGTAVVPERAEHLGVNIDLVFIRDDGYVLGSPNKLRSEAYNIWSRQWTHFYDVQKEKLRSVNQYYDYLREQRMN